MNLLRLSKKAESYSSPSMTKGPPFTPGWALSGRSRGTPPTSQPGSAPAARRRTAAMQVVVVLPWVPATTRLARSRSRRVRSSSGSETYSRFRERSRRSTSGWPREATLPTTTRSGLDASMRSASQPSRIVTPAARRWSDIGG